VRIDKYRTQIESKLTDRNQPFSAEWWMQKKLSKIVLSEFRQIFTNFDNNWHKDGQNDARCTYFLSHLIYVNTLRCKTQMLQIVA